MLYYLFTWLNKEYNVSGARTVSIHHIQGSDGYCIVTYNCNSVWKRLINFLKQKQIGETVRDLGLQANNKRKEHQQWVALLSYWRFLFQHCCLLILNKVYIRLMLLCTVWLGIIGFLDDYLKLKARKQAKQRGRNMKRKTAMVWQACQKLLARSVWELSLVRHYILTAMLLWKEN